MKLLQKPSANGHTSRIESFTLPVAPSRRRWWIAGAALLALAAVFAVVFVVRARSEAASRSFLSAERRQAGLDR